MGKFVIEKGPGGHYFFKLVSGSGEIVFTSEKYFFKKACKHAIETMRSDALNFLRYKLESTYDGKYYFRLYAAGGQSIGRSCSCDSAEMRNIYVERVKNSSPYAGLIDLSYTRELNQA